MRALCKVLAFVDDEAEERGEPELAVLVVRQSDGLPGQGWWVGGAKKHGYTGLWEGPDGGEADPQAAAPGVRLLGGTERLAFANRARHGRTAHFHRRPRTTTASGSTAGSSGTCPMSASTSSRAGRGPGSCGSSGKRAAPGDRIEAGQEIRVPPAEARRRGPRGRSPSATR